MTFFVDEDDGSGVILGICVIEKTRLVENVFPQTNSFYLSEIDATEKLVGPSEEVGALQRIWDLCISGEDELIVADNYNHRLVSMRKNGDHIGPVVTSESLNFPKNVACGHAGEIIISEPEEHIFRPHGTYFLKQALMLYSRKYLKYIQTRPLYFYSLGE